MTNTTIEPRVVEAGRGGAWWTAGLRTFTSGFWAWIGIMIIYLIITVLISVVPYVGDVGHYLLTPVFLGGLMIGCRALERGEPLRVAHLFEGFQGANFVPLMIIGAVNIAIGLGIGALAFASVLGGMHMGALTGGDPLETLLGSARAITGTGLLVTLLILTIGAVFAMLNWFAPALVALHGLSAVEAMKQSFVCSLRNWAPFLVYGLIGIGILVAGIVAFGGLAFALGAGAYFGSGGWGAMIGIALLLVALFSLVALFVGPIVFGSTYASYRDTFNDGGEVLVNPAYH